MLIVPAAMTLFGESAWWLPNWLDRLIPHVDVEGANLDRTNRDDASVDEPAEVPNLTVPR
jgi:RND superfamily putative drug exporter